jgi:hypothetical protein
MIAKTHVKKFITWLLLKYKNIQDNNDSSHQSILAV